MIYGFVSISYCAMTPCSYLVGLGVKVFMMLFIVVYK